MAKPGRPGISYVQFVETWEELLKEGQAGTNRALEILGGNKSTIVAFREKYEREKASKELALIKSVELPEAVHQAIVGVKVKEIEALEKVQMELKTRIDQYLSVIKELEGQLAAAKVELEDAKFDFDSKKLSMEKSLAAVQARFEDLEQREQKQIVRYDQLLDQHNQTKQEAAVAKKEVEMLRERVKA